MDQFIATLLELPIAASFFLLLAGVSRALGAIFGLWGLYFILGPAVIVRTVLALILSAPMIFAQIDSYVALSEETQRFALLTIPLREFIIGFAIGLLMSLPFFAIMGAALVIEQYRGDFSPGIEAPENAQVGSYGALNMIMVLFIFVELGGFMILVATLYDSYALIEPGVPGLSFPAGFSAALAGILQNVFVTLIAFALPVLLLLMLLEFAINMASRLADQIQLPSIDFLAKNLALLFAMPVLVLALSRAMQATFDNAPPVLPLLAEIIGL
ncbi:MAG: flagellar biosynthetic protein FliR [Pseudomonadota bacterium]